MTIIIPITQQSKPEELGRELSLAEPAHPFHMIYSQNANPSQIKFYISPAAAKRSFVLALYVSTFPHTAVNVVLDVPVIPSR